jgi:O-acetyl-ADP-ribose deacetylase (regulator of RNase III)
MNEEIILKEILPGKQLKLIKGDITEEVVDAIVNAANSHLKHGGGVAGAIVRKGGQVIQEESDKISPIAVGEAAITSAGKLAAHYVIHAVGPQWGEGNEDEKLSNAVQNSLKIAAENQLQSISLPAISSGIFGFPKPRCAKLILEAINKYLEMSPESSLKEIRICLFDHLTLQEFTKIF